LQLKKKTDGSIEESFSEQPQRQNVPKGRLRVFSWSCRMPPATMKTVLKVAASSTDHNVHQVIGKTFKECVWKHDDKGQKKQIF
jgi:flavoprotein